IGRKGCRRVDERETIRVSASAFVPLCSSLFVSVFPNSRPVGGVYMQTVLAPWVSLMFFMSVHAFEVDYCGDNDEDKNIEVFDVYAKRTGSFVKRFSWEISVRENGEGVLTV